MVNGSYPKIGLAALSILHCCGLPILSSDGIECVGIRYSTWYMIKISENYGDVNKNSFGNVNVPVP